MVAIYRGTSVVQQVKPISANLSMALSGQNEVVLTFDLPSAVVFELGDTVTAKGSTYYLNELPSIEKVSDHQFHYVATFEASYYDLAKIQFMYEGMGEFYFNGTLQDIMDIMFENVYRVYGAGHLELGYVEATEFRNLYFKNQSCSQVLYAMMDEWEMEYYFDGNTLNISSSIGEDSGETFRYGKGQGLYSITREKVQSKDIITRLWVTGSERNIPYDYRPATGDTRNLLKRSGAVDLVDAIDINGYAVKTYEGGNRWKFTNAGAGDSDIRLTVDETLLTDGNPYYASIYYSNPSGGPGTISVRWVTYSSIVPNAGLNGRIIVNGSGTYDSSHNYMTIQLDAGESVVLYDAQIEATEATPYEGGYSLTGGRFTRRLMFAAPGSHYVESNVATYGLVEASKTFDDIYPRLEARVTSIGTELQFCSSDVDFDVNLYLIGGVEATVHFNTGDCAGYEFTLDKNEGYVHTGGTVGDRQFTIIQNQDKQGYVVPTSGGIRPEVGDEFVILNIEMPSSYVSAAESELYDKAVEYIQQNDEPRVRYRIDVDPKYGEENSLEFVIGDAVTLVDTDINVNRLIRVVEIDYDLTREGAMALSLSEDLEPMLIERLNAEEERVDTILALNDFNSSDLMIGYRSILEMQHLIFDGTGYFDPENIKPLSIETLMLTVGSKWYAFTLECTMDGNADGTDTKFTASAGRLIHFTISDTGPVTWTLFANSQTGLAPGSAYYIYAYCHKTNYSDATNQVIVDTTQRDVDGTTHWNFMVGVLHSSANGYRDISLSYGMTQINGGFITTGKIESIDGNTYFDLNNSTIGGAITFESGSSGYSNISDIPTSLADINSDEYDAYEAKVTLFDQTTEPTTGMQVGDLWIDDDDQVWYYTGSAWISATVIDALEAYLTAAMGKSVYRQATAPTSGMVEGDVWIDTDDGNKVYVYYDGSWTETTNATSLAAAALADLKVQTFYQTTAPTTGMDIGDFWVDTDDDIQYMWTGSQWIGLTTQDGLDALAAAATAQSTADGKIVCFYQDTAPTTGMAFGDIWFDTDDGNRVYVYDSGWQDAQDTDIASAINAAQTAQTTADGKAIVFYAGTEPTTGMSEGDLWIDTGNNNTAYVYTGAAWVLYTVNDALQALSDAADAQATADGKVTTFVQSYTTSGYPTAQGEGDLWYNTDTGKIHRWDGFDWDLDVADVTQTIIDGGLVTTGRLVVQNDTTEQGGISGTTSSGTTDVGLWLGATYANRTTAPFRVTHGGSVTMTDATMQTATGTDYVKIEGQTVQLYDSGGVRAKLSHDPAKDETGELYLYDDAANYVCYNVFGIGYNESPSYGFETMIGFGSAVVEIGDNFSLFITDGDLSIGAGDAILYGDLYLKGMTTGSTGYILYYDNVTDVITYAAAPGTLSSPLTTKGDIWCYSTTQARLPVGTNGQVLSSDSNETTGLKWIDNSATSNVSVANQADNRVVTATGTTDALNAEANLEFNGNDLMVGTPTSPYGSYTHEIVVGSATSSSTGWIEVVGNQSTDVVFGGISFHNASASQANKMVASLEVHRNGSSNTGTIYMYLYDSGSTKEVVWEAQSTGQYWYVAGAQELNLTGSYLGPNSANGLSLGQPTVPFNNSYTTYAYAGSMRVTDLAGTGTRVVVTDADGDLSAATLPVDGVTSVAAGAGMNFTTITSTGSVVMGTPSTITGSTTNSASGTTHTHAVSGLAEISGTPTATYLSIWTDSSTIGSASYIYETVASGLITVTNFNATGTAKFTSLSGPAANHLVVADVDGYVASGNLTGHVTTSSSLATTLTVSAITGQTLGTSIVDADEFLYSDGGVIKRVAASTIKTYISGSYVTGSGSAGYLAIWTSTSDMTYGNLGGDVSTDGTTATLLAAAITNRTELTSGLASTDELLVSDAGALKRMDISVIQAYMQSNLSFGTGTITGSGTTNQIAYFTAGTALSSGNLGGDFSSSGLTVTATTNLITGKSNLASFASTDELLVHDAGTGNLYRADISVLASYMAANLPFGTGTVTGTGTSPQLAYWNGTSSLTSGNLTGDVTSTGTSTTIASGAVDSGMLSSTIVTGFSAIGSIASADSFIIHDSGVGVREATITQLQTYMQSNLSFGTGTVTGTGSSGYAARWSSTSALTYASELQFNSPSAGNVRINTNNLRIDHLSAGYSYQPILLNTTGDTSTTTNIRINYGSYELYVVGEIYATSNIYAYSDIRGKNVLGEIGPVLPKFRRLDTFIYELKSDPEGGSNYGVSAQEIGKLFPFAQTYDKENDVYGISLNSMSALHTAAIKELEEENALLWDRIAKLEEKINNILNDVT